MIDNPKLGVVLSIEYIYNYCLGETSKQGLAYNMVNTGSINNIIEMNKLIDEFEVFYNSKIDLNNQILITSKIIVEAYRSQDYTTFWQFIFSNIGQVYGE
jgi:hypothetical protein